MASVTCILTELDAADQKYQRAYDQWARLAERTAAARVRHARAARCGNPAFCAALHLQVLTLDSTAQAFWQYMQVAADRLEDIKYRLLEDCMVDWDEVCTGYL